MAHKVHDDDVRRTLVEFGRDFLSGSIVGGCLRVSNSVAIASKLSEEFDLFSKCNHNGETFCNDCRRNLLLAGYSAEKLIPTGGKLAVALSSATFRNEGMLLKSLARFVSLVIKGCIQTHKNYYSLFDKHQNVEVRYYNANHKDGNRLVDCDDAN